MTKDRKELVVYQAKNGAIEFRGDFEHDTVWATQKQVASVFNVDVNTVSEHLVNIYKSGELNKKATTRKFRIVQKEANRTVEREVNHYNLDAILSVGYRVNSKRATQFRVWATKTLKQHLLEGYTINKKRIGTNYGKFLEAISDIKAIHPGDDRVSSDDVLELVTVFAQTWLSLEAYDTEKLPKTGATKKQVLFTSEELSAALLELKKELVKMKQASDLFGREREKEAVKGITGSIFQSFDGKDLYPSVEEKAAHLLYFMVKNHPFVDGNKRSGAFALVWYLRASGILHLNLTPGALTSLTLLVAESDPKHKDKVVRLIMMLLK